MGQRDYEIRREAARAYEGAQDTADPAWEAQTIEAHLREVTALGVWWLRRVELVQATTDRGVAFVGAGLMEPIGAADELMLANLVNMKLLVVVGDADPPQGYQLTRAGGQTLGVVKAMVEQPAESHAQRVKIF